MKTNIITQFKTLPMAAVNNNLSYFQVAVLTIIIIALVAGGMYWADPTSFNAYKG